MSALIAQTNYPTTGKVVKIDQALDKLTELYTKCHY
jgi:hypothetical protein